MGMSWLLYGAFFYDISDWDVGVILIMGGITYVCAPWTIKAIYNAVYYRPKRWFLQIIAAIIPPLFAVDWSYWLYHTIMGNQMLRWENFKVSMALYFICGLIWLYQGSMQNMKADLKSIVKRGVTR